MSTTQKLNTSDKENVTTDVTAELTTNVSTDETREEEVNDVNDVITTKEEKMPKAINPRILVGVLEK